MSELQASVGHAAAPEAAEPTAYERRSGIATSHPGPVNAVAGAINIALPNSLETQKEIAMVAWGDFLQLIRKTVGRLPRETRDRAPGPLASGPGSVSKEPGGMPGFAQAAGEAL